MLIYDKEIIMANKSSNVSPTQSEANKVKFDVWYAMRVTKIPAQHHKEILKADFTGRGLKDFDTVENFDKALRKYGVSL